MGNCFSYFLHHAFDKWFTGTGLAVSDPPKESTLSKIRLAFRRLSKTGYIQLGRDPYGTLKWQCGVRFSFVNQYRIGFYPTLVIWCMRFRPGWSIKRKAGECFVEGRDYEGFCKEINPIAWLDVHCIWYSFYFFPYRWIGRKDGRVNTIWSELLNWCGFYHVYSIKFPYRFTK